MEAGFERDTLDYAGARSLSFMANFLHGRQWWLLSPHPELVLESPAPFCAAVPGKEYIVYLRWGGVAKVDLRPSAPEDQFQYTWIDLVDEKVGRPRPVAGGAIRCSTRPRTIPAWNRARIGSCTSSGERRHCAGGRTPTPARAPTPTRAPARARARARYRARTPARAPTPTRARARARNRNRSRNRSRTRTRTRTRSRTRTRHRPPRDHDASAWLCGITSTSTSTSTRTRTRTKTRTITSTITSTSMSTSPGLGPSASGGYPALSPKSFAAMSRHDRLPHSRKTRGSEHWQDTPLNACVSTVGRLRERIPPAPPTLESRATALRW